VALETCTEAVAPEVRLPKLQLNVWPDTEQLPGPVYAGLIAQLIPVPDGRVSLRVAAVAVAPVLPAASVNPIEVPAETLAASAVLERLRFGHCTVVVADDCTELAFAALRVATFV
jgi:hypothetical protein